MSEFVKGQIMTFAETRCPTCGRDDMHGAGTAFAVKRVWTGDHWALLDSYEGGALSRDLGGPVQNN